MQAVNIKGRVQQTLNVSTSAAHTVPLPAGTYDVWSDVDIYIKVAAIANDVTISSGYLIAAGNIIPIIVDNNDRIGAIANTSGTMRFHQTA